ncbi:MAG: hypothetical protein CBC22_03920 [Alphaproteobacteria bacterium TMED62]|mgnify:CR=1 FL=1|nr:MAG: hypothetical protein CBC22_03920 [Alphaproteobacteria bacterium TMED62]|tara:strand:- start:1392 stop:2639 length:1248 start_codon:yes stop_codon:yes gene_type:complete
MAKIGFCGASHLGLCYSAAAVKKGNKIFCYDFDHNKIRNYKRFEIDIDEPKLKNILIENKKQYNFSCKISDLSKCDFVFFSYDVGTDHKGNGDYRKLRENLKSLIESLDIKVPLIILSQVPPGFTRLFSSKKHNIFYQVETLIFGRAIDRALKPERFIIGCSSTDKELFSKYKKFLKSFNCPVLIMKYESAELSKIAINCYLAADVTLTNTLAEISKVIGANWDEILPTLKLDKRIGKNAYLNPGLGLSGGNIERDLTTLNNIGEKKDANTEFIKTIIKHSKYSKKWLLKTVSIFLKNKNSINITVLGLAYKGNTNAIKNSPSIEFLKKMKKYKVKVYDPVVKNIGLKNTIEYQSEYEALEGADILVIATSWDVFKRLNIRIIKSKMRGNVIIDPLKVLNKEIVEKFKFKYYCLG